MTDHLHPLHGGWSLWEWLELRGSGFPAAMLAPLAARVATASCDELRTREDEAAAARAAAVDLVEALRQRAASDARRPFRDALKRLRNGQLPDPAALPPDARTAIDVLRDADLRRDEQRAAAGTSFDAERRAVSDALRATARDPRFHEALLWQNRTAYVTGIAAWLRQPADAAGNSKSRQTEALVASYLQRYGTKNDNISFFGPIGWGRFVRQPADAAAMPGAALLSRRRVYFEHWGIDELAELAAQDDALLRDVKPRRSPTIWLDGTTLHVGNSRAELPIEYARLLAACDGTHTACELAAPLVEELGLDDADEAYAMLVELRDRGLVRWTLEIPTHEPNPEHALRGLLAAAAGETRASTLVALDDLEAARDRVAAAAGDPPALDRALAELDDTFVRITARDATRRAGGQYAGRTLVYEDCIRDFDLRIGPAFLDRLGPALSLLLHSARWYTYTIAQRFRAAFDRLHAELRVETGAEVVDYVRFCERAAPLYEAGIIDDVVAELQARWAGILRVDSPERHVVHASNAVRAAILDAFAAPHPGWPLARFHSPDLMIAARSADDAIAGAALFVVGEIHTGNSMMTTPICLRECPWPELVGRACETDVGVTRVASVSPKRRDTRIEFGPTAGIAYALELGGSVAHLPRDRVLAAGELVVASTPDGLVVETRDRRTRFDIIVAFEKNLVSATVTRFSPVRRAAHVPRVQIDELVLVRERWQFAPADLGFATAPHGLDQFSGARRWASAHSIPRHIFVRVPEELKPVYVDLDSPIYVEILAKLVRNASLVTVSEMLPSPDDLWLADEVGNRYTAELRLTAVDPVPWLPPQQS